MHRVGVEEVMIMMRMKWAWSLGDWIYGTFLSHNMSVFLCLCYFVTPMQLSPEFLLSRHLEIKML